MTIDKQTCIECENTVIVADPFESGRCEDCFESFIGEPWNRGLTAGDYWRNERQARHWYGKSIDDKRREARNDNR